MAGEKEEDKNKKAVIRAPFDQAKDYPPGYEPRVYSKALQSTFGNSFFDASDSYANNYHNYIMFTSTISGASVKFKAFLTAFEDQFKSDWNSEQVYGRNDPIQTFQSTTRTISVGWDVPASSIWEAKSNFESAAQLIRMLYPGYRSVANVSTINKSPVIKVVFRNLISGQKGEELLVTLDGLSFSPDLEAGFFDADESADLKAAGDIPKDELIPKLLKFSCNMVVLHSKTIGHNGYGKWPSGLSQFPNLPDWGSPYLVQPLGGTFGATTGGAAFGEGAKIYAYKTEAEIQKAIEDAQDDSGAGDIEVSQEQTNKEKRQDKRDARKKSKEIPDASTAQNESVLAPNPTINGKQ